jgi:uncharacterized protein YndB with AHSA1/START domain
MQRTKGAAATTRNDRTIVITRDFDAPRALVFEAWTTPAHVVVWWDPTGRPLAACEIDLRPGGAFRFVHLSGAGHAFEGHYVEIVPPSRLVFTTRAPATSADAIGTLTFAERAGRTTLTMTIECQSGEDRDALLAMRIDTGTMRTLENLDAYLRGLDQ